MHATREIWVFGDWRNYFQNRVTLQLLAKARQLAEPSQARVCALVFGQGLDEWVMEYTAHGADRLYVCDHPSLEGYPMQAFTGLLVDLAKKSQPQVILVGATSFGKELAARAAKRLGVGLTSDCVELSLDDQGRLIQTAPAFGGNLLAEIVSTGEPQMATVRPGAFQEQPHDYVRTAEVVRLDPPAKLPDERLRLIESRRLPARQQELENAAVVVVGGRGLGSKKRFKNLHELARLLGGEVGATRPVVYSQWAGHEALIGQAGRQVKPKLLLSFGVSGAIQHTAGIDADFIVAVNKNPNAVMMQMADVGIVADASQTCLALIRELKDRLRG